jgi:hypothetical protein
MRGATVKTIAGVFGAALLMAPAQAQNMEIPDFNGLWQRPENAEGRTFQQPASGPGPIEDFPDAGAFRIGDYNNPILRPHAAAAVREHGERGRAGEVMLPPWSLCWPSGVPLVLNMGEPIQILQDSEYVVIIYRRDMQVRRIKLNASVPDDFSPSWYGHSVGHYESPHTLVVETVGQNDKADVDRFGTPRSEAIRVVERYTMNPDRSQFRVDFTVEDPETFTTPWSGSATYYPAAEPFVERICAENNKDPNGGIFPIPIDTTPDF